MASSIILHQDKICQGVLLSCLVQPQQEALLMTAIRMQLPPRAGSLACRRGSCRHRGATEGVADVEGSIVGGLPLLCLFVLAFFSARLKIICTDTNLLYLSGIAPRRVGVPHYRSADRSLT